MIWGSFRGLYGVELTSDGLALKDGENAKDTKVHIAGYDTSTGWNGSTYEGAYVILKMAIICLCHLEHVVKV